MCKYRAVGEGGMSFAPLFSVTRGEGGLCASVSSSAWYFGRHLDVQYTQF